VAAPPEEDAEGFDRGRRGSWVAEMIAKEEARGEAGEAEAEAAVLETVLPPGSKKKKKGKAALVWPY
jgi:hypothetical protein